LANQFANLNAKSIWQTILANLGPATWFAKSKCQIDLANHLGKFRSGKMVWQIKVRNIVLPNLNANSKCHINLANHLGKSRSGKMVWAKLELGLEG
jgi:hypothetical protein